MVSLNKNGVAHEENFWKGFVKTDRFLKDWCSSEKTNELNQEVYDFIQKVNPDEVLDVGSGPISILKGSVKKVTAADPLSSEYQDLFDYSEKGLFDFIPHPYAAEDLPASWNKHFDIVHCSNALDHVVDPFDAYNRLFECVKRGGYLIIQNHKDEAKHENYQGFHQWNIFLTEKGLHISGVQAKNFIPKSAIDYEVIESKELLLDTGRNWIIWIVKKL